MAYNFLDGRGGYTFKELSHEIDKFNRYDEVSNLYNSTYIKARESIDWKNLGSDIEKKIQFLIDWKTDYVRIHRSEYFDWFKQLSHDEPFVSVCKKYSFIDLLSIDLTSGHTLSDLSYLYKVADTFLKPTAASKILHMYNPSLFPIWDRYMRNNLYRTTGHNPGQYVRWLSMMQEELNLVIGSTIAEFSLSKSSALNKIIQLDHPTCSLLRIMDKVNYNNSRGSLGVQSVKKVIRDIHKDQNEGGCNMVARVRASGGKIDTGLKLSEFIRDYLPNIHGFSMNKQGGFTFDEEKSLWREGKMTAAFLKQIASRLQYPTFQVSNYDLLNSIRADRQKIIELLQNKPHLDSNIRIKSKTGKTNGSSTILRSPLLDD